MNNSTNDTLNTNLTTEQQKAHAALEEIERMGARSRLTIRAGIKAGTASARPMACYGCVPQDR